MILVTGGTGLVGSHLLLALAEAERTVRALYRNNSSFANVKRIFAQGRSPEEAEMLFGRIEWREADLLDIPDLKEAFENITMVYHCAALVSFDPSSHKKLRKVNIEGTANVVNLCIRNKVKKLAFVSSIATLDLKVGTSEITETSEWNKELDHSMYAISKYGAEMEVWRASQEGVPVVIVNPGIIVGPGSWDTGSGLMFKKVWNGLKFHFPKVTGFVGVDDVVSALLQITESPIENEQYLLVSENLSFRDVLEMVARSLGKPAASRPLSPWMVYMGWMLDKSLGVLGRKRSISRISAKGLFHRTYYNSNKIREDLGFQFEPMAQVIERTGRAFIEEVKE